MANGVTYTIVNRHTPLELDQIEARVRNVGTIEAPKREGQPEQEAGVYVVVTLSVKNKLAFSARFDDAEQVLLANRRDQYAEHRRASSVLVDSFASRRRKIRPGQWATGRVAFLVPAEFATSLSEPGVNLLISNFNDAGRIENADRLGAIRLWK